MNLKVTQTSYEAAIIVNDRVEFEDQLSLKWKILAQIFFLLCRAETFVVREYWKMFKFPHLDETDLFQALLKMDKRKWPVAKFLYEASIYVTFLKHNAMQWQAIEALYTENEWLKKEKTWWGRTITSVLSKVENIVATRNRLRNTKRAMFGEIVYQLNTGVEEIRIVSLASGSARSSIDVVAAILTENPELLNRFRIWFVDMDREAFEFSKALADERYPGLAARFEFLEMKISSKPAGIAALNKFLSRVKPTIVEMVGFGDYMSRQKAVAVFGAIYETLVPGGLLITNNVKDNEERRFLEIVVTWTMISRTEAEVHEILAEAGFTIRTILNDPINIQPVYLGRKLY